MAEQSKISIRFFRNRQVRAIWDDELNKWWFSVLDIVAVLNDEDDYTKTRNYWKYLKGKLKKENPQLVSATNQLKLVAPDGKHRLTDTLDAEGIVELAKTCPTIEPLIFSIGLHIVTTTLTDKVGRKPILSLRADCSNH